MALKLHDQFSTLENLINTSAASFIFINGPTECGKSRLLQRVSDEIKTVPILFIDSLECITMTILFEQILSFVQTLLLEKYPINKVAVYKPCSTIAELISRLNSFNWPDNYKIVLLVDEVDQLFQLDSNTFSVLLKLPQMMDYKIALVMSSREEFEDFGPQITNGLVPIKISLKSFTSEESREIICAQLSQNSETSPNSSIQSTIKIVQQVANCTIKELSVLRNLTISILENQQNNPTTLTKSSLSNSKLPKLIQDRLDSSNRLDFYIKKTISTLNSTQKYLLLSSFIASFQSVKDDLKVFGSSGNSKKKIKRSNSASNNSSVDNGANSKSSDKLTLNLPKLFDQTRLFAIFYFLIEDYGNPLPSPQQISLNLKSLCERGLLKCPGSGNRIDSLKYRVNISRDFATSVADELKIDLKNLIITM